MTSTSWLCQVLKLWFAEHVDSHLRREENIRNPAKILLMTEVCVYFWSVLIFSTGQPGKCLTQALPSEYKQIHYLYSSITIKINSFPTFVVTCMSSQSFYCGHVILVLWSFPCFNSPTDSSTNTRIFIKLPTNTMQKPYSYLFRYIDFYRFCLFFAITTRTFLYHTYIKN
jgi:hypothetical protein